MNIDAILEASMEAMNAGEPDRALVGLEQILEAEPQHAQVLFFKGCALTECGDDEQAIEAFEQSAKYAGEMAGLPLFNLGNAYQRQGEFAKAAQSFQAATEADPTMADAWINLGRLMDDGGGHQEALDCYQIALKIDDQDPVTWSNQGNSFRSLQMIDQAEDSYRKALALNPNEWPAKIGLGAVLALQGSNEGLDLIAEVSEATGHPSALFEQGTALALLGRHAEAIPIYEQLINLGMNEPSMWNNRGECLAKVDHVSEAIASFDRAIEEDENFVSAYFGKARVLVNCDRIEDATPVVKKYFEIASPEMQQAPAVQALANLCGLACDSEGAS